MENSTQATEDFVVQLRTICDSTLHAYLRRIADTPQKRHCLHISWTAAEGHGKAVSQTSSLNFKPFRNSKPFPESLEALDTLLEDLKVFDLYPSDFQQLHDLGVLLVTIFDHRSLLSGYLKSFRSDPERSGEFHHEIGLWGAIVATRYMRCLRTLPDPG